MRDWFDVMVWIVVVHSVSVLKYIILHFCELLEINVYKKKCFDVFQMWDSVDRNSKSGYSVRLIRHD